MKKHWWVAAVFAGLLAADQLTKYIVIQTLRLGESWPSEGFFRFTHVGNTGASFGLFGGNNGLLIIAALVGVGVLVFFYRTHPNPGILVRLSLTMMMAGALGNLIDRILVGHVTDFIDVGPFYIFNIADSSIVTGVIILAVSMLFMNEGGKKDEEPGDLSGPDEQSAVPDGAERHGAHGS